MALLHILHYVDLGWGQHAEFQKGEIIFFCSEPEQLLLAHKTSMKSEGLVKNRVSQGATRAAFSESMFEDLDSRVYADPYVLNTMTATFLTWGTLSTVSVQNFAGPLLGNSLKVKQ